MKTRNKEVVVDLFCGAGGESQGIHWSAEKADVDVEMYAVCPKIAEALTHNAFTERRR